MSYTEFHKGKLRVLTRSTKETLDYIEKNNLQDIIKETDYCNEIDFDTNDPKYIILHKDGIYYGDNCEHMLCEYLKNTEHEGGGDYLADIKRISESDFEFTLIFYNGGTCEEEILSEKISELLKKPYEVESEIVKIGPRESYMILDVFQYALIKMKEENIDYLFCNYSKEEMAKFGQQFGDMNLKNGW